MTPKRIRQFNQQRKREVSQESGILQRAAIRSVSDAEVQSTDDKEAQPLSNLAFSKDFSRVSISTTKPKQIMTKLMISPVVQRVNIPVSVKSTEGETIQGQEMPQASGMQKENKTGLPDNLKAGIENLSGFSMDDVKVHYKSSKPAHLQALAYTQGTNIYMGLGQERYLPHEAWHVVQQKQGRVQPTLQLQTNAINNDPLLEQEADEMGIRATALISAPVKLSEDEVFSQKIQRKDSRIEEKCVYNSYFLRGAEKSNGVIQAQANDRRSILNQFGAQHRNLDVNPNVVGQGGIYRGAVRTEDAPFIPQFLEIFNKIQSWDLYMENELKPTEYKKFQLATNINTIYLYASEIKSLGKEYKERFRSRPLDLENLEPGEYESIIQAQYKSQVDQFIRHMNLIHQQCIEWYKNNVPNPQKKFLINIDTNVEKAGTNLWRQKWQDAIFRVNTIMMAEWKIHKRSIEDWLQRQNKIREQQQQEPFGGTIENLSYIGSTATGYKGPPKQHIRFNPKDFDVDANLNAPPLAEYAMNVDGIKPDKNRIFSRNTTINPLKTFCDVMEQRLIKEVPGIQKDPNDKFDVAIIAQNTLEQQQLQDDQEKLWKLRKIYPSRFEELGEQIVLGNEI